MNKHANIVGCGLMGGSLALALGEREWSVSIDDRDATRVESALQRGIGDRQGIERDAAVTFVATPVGAVADAAREALAATDGPVTDVGSVKHSIVAEVGDPRFVGGHPMAGSHQDGLDGADPAMFEGAAWVLTPDDLTADDTFATVSSVVRALGADLITMEAARHDELVAMVSHVPHLTAATLMRVADERATNHAALLRMAAGGFRDMTRIAGGHPGIWPDICTENREAISATLDRVIDSLTSLRHVIYDSDTTSLIELLETAREARLSLPSSAPANAELIEMRVPVLDRRGEMAAVASRATELGVNLYDVEIAHTTEGERGVITVVIERAMAASFADALRDDGYRPSTRDL